MTEKYTSQEYEYTCRFIKETTIEGLYIIERPKIKDDRGFFREVLHLDELEISLMKRVDFVQINHSMSLPNVIRALHAENWNKLVYPVTGRMFTAIADIRPFSKTFGEVETFTFEEEDHKALFISKGLANSICVVGQEPVHYLYLVDAYYDGKDFRAVAWDDPDLAITWPVDNPILSERDCHNPTLMDLFPDQVQNLRRDRDIKNVIDFSI